MSAITEFLFPAPAKRTVGGIVTWWEKRRLAYNVVVNLLNGYRRPATGRVLADGLDLVAHQDGHHQLDHGQVTLPHGRLPAEPGLPQVGARLAQGTRPRRVDSRRSGRRWLGLVGRALRLVFPDRRIADFC